MVTSTLSLGPLPPLAGAGTALVFYRYYTFFLANTVKLLTYLFVVPTTPSPSLVMNPSYKIFIEIFTAAGVSLDSGVIVGVLWKSQTWMLDQECIIILYNFPNDLLGHDIFSKKFKWFYFSFMSLLFVYFNITSLCWRKYTSYSISRYRTPIVSTIAHNFLFFDANLQYRSIWYA